jgi:hypothetical protein
LPLPATDEVKVEAEHRQRLTQLHVSYGNALFAARGYGAPETTKAFAKARESASGDKDAPGRLAADYGAVNSARASAISGISLVGAKPSSAGARTA